MNYLKIKLPSIVMVVFLVFQKVVCYGQDTIVEDYEEPRTFSSTRVINGHSVETLGKGFMDMRIEHRFGDMAGDFGGWENMFGFDNLSDMRIALEYGITDDLMIGFGRSKGTGFPYRSLLDGFVKYRILRQEKSKMPVSLTAVVGSFFSYMKASNDESQVSYFPKNAHRFSYFTQLNLAKHFGDYLSLSLMPTYVHRNYVYADDMNDLFALGGAFRIKLFKRFAVISEYYYIFNPNNFRPQMNYKNSLAFGLEWFTFGHSFTINLTNSGGLGEAQFIPYTRSNWLKGQFRFGFCVGRKFSF
ncbi:MAG: hypothetical protein FJZ67_08540 [Bacteroidetes bacterium]|nr:hypothetical protein [Bacteroidota bacterium]